MNYTSNIIINGDLNVDLLRVNNNKLLEIISEFNLTNVIKEPTRNGALLDPILEYPAMSIREHLPQNSVYLTLISDQKTHQLLYHCQLYLYLSDFL
jgi:hypothetical protein